MEFDHAAVRIGVIINIYLYIAGSIGYLKHFEVRTMIISNLFGPWKKKQWFSLIRIYE